MERITTQDPVPEVTSSLENATWEDAWRWLLALRDAPVVEQCRTVPLSPNPAHTLTVSTDGHWHSTAPLSTAATEALNLYVPACAPADQPFVIAQMGQSLDGRIATHCGASHYINGQDGLVHLHRLRALVDAVVVGSGTAGTDNPRLTVRLAEGPNPVRVILDRHGRVPASHKVFCDGRAPTLRLFDPSCGTPNNPTPDVECIPVTMAPSDAAPASAESGVEAVLEALSARGLNRVLIEGGGLTVSRFLDAGALDRLHVIVAPMIIGSGLPAFTLPIMDTLDHALRPANRRFDLGSDLVFDLQLKHDSAPASGQ